MQALRSFSTVFWPLLTLGCAAESVDSDPWPEDPTPEPTPEPSFDPEDFNGEWIEDGIEAPQFNATNRDGGARDRDDLIGHPSVLWFYPAAFTGT